MSEIQIEIIEDRRGSGRFDGEVSFRIVGDTGYFTAEVSRPAWLNGALTPFFNLNANGSTTLPGMLTRIRGIQSFITGDIPDRDNYIGQMGGVAPDRERLRRYLMDNPQAAAPATLRIGSASIETVTGQKLTMKYRNVLLDVATAFKVWLKANSIDPAFLAFLDQDQRVMKNIRRYEAALSLALDQRLELIAQAAAQGFDLLARVPITERQEVLF